MTESHWRYTLVRIYIQLRKRDMAIIVPTVIDKTESWFTVVHFMGLILQIMDIFCVICYGIAKMYRESYHQAWVLSIQWIVIRFKYEPENEVTSTRTIIPVEQADM